MFEHSHIYIPKSGNLGRKNSKIALLMFCQGWDLWTKLKHSQSRDLEGIQWILWIYTDAAHGRVWYYNGKLPVHQSTTERMPASWTNNAIAGVNWLHGFMRKMPRLSLHSTEVTSLAQYMAFNCYNTDMFFNNLNAVQSRYRYHPEDIYSVDKSGLVTIQKLYFGCMSGFGQRKWNNNVIFSTPF